MCFKETLYPISNCDTGFRVKVSRRPTDRHLKMSKRTDHTILLNVNMCNSQLLLALLKNKTQDIISKIDLTACINSTVLKLHFSINQMKTCWTVRFRSVAIIQTWNWATIVLLIWVSHHSDEDFKKGNDFFSRISARKLLCIPYTVF